jgi:hypothetical protein
MLVARKRSEAGNKTNRSAADARNIGGAFVFLAVSVSDQNSNFNPN